MAPELLLGKVYSEKVDCFAFSIVFFEVLTEEEPYANLTKNMGTIELQVANSPNFRPRSDKLSKFKPEVVELMEKGWSHDPDERPSMETFRKFFEEWKLTLEASTSSCQDKK